VEEVLIFGVGGTEWALPAEVVRQVLAPRPVTRVPGSGSSLVGLVAWRASVIPVLDLGARPEVGTLLVVEQDGELVALLVDQVKRFAPTPGDQSLVPPLLDLGQVADEQ
jgi:purine-binding chemotaxis protein CheW